jgi:hypothetical protein
MLLVRAAEGARTTDPLLDLRHSPKVRRASVLSRSTRVAAPRRRRWNAMDARFSNGQAHNLRKAVGGVLGPAVVLDDPAQIKQALEYVMVQKTIGGQVGKVVWFGGNWFESANHVIDVTGLEPDGFVTLNAAAERGSF